MVHATNRYRPNAAVIVTDGKGRILLCERAELGFIQTVQGGIDPGESPEAAAGRELEEELGLEPGSYKILRTLDQTFTYDWTPEVIAQSPEGYVGQCQQFFLAEVNPDTEFCLDKHHREFSRVWWGTPEEMLRKVWDLKRPGIEAALTGFGFLKEERTVR